MTVARIWRTAVDRDRLLDYERFAAEVSLPMFRMQPGFAGVVMMRHDDECIVLTLWDDDAATAALARSPSYLETVRRIEAQGFLLGDSALSTYDVHLLVAPPTAA